jgi:acetyl-CoA carboxylase biotin carboxylase subunit
VTEGQTILIIEAMKTMNQIPAPRSGTVTHSVEDGQPGRIWRTAHHHRLGTSASCSPRVLIANRGEIALRVLRACKELGIQTVAVHSTADADAMHVRLADESVCIGPPPSRDSYLNIHEIVAACEITGADAVHPGLRFPVGEREVRRDPRRPWPDLHRSDGRAYPHHGRQDHRQEDGRSPRHSRGPGSDGAVKEEDARSNRRRDRLSGADQGNGRRRWSRHEGRSHRGGPVEAMATARSEAGSAFGNDAVYMEKYLAKPRHIEIQVLGDGEGHAIHLGERDCSLQRRHQKVWEEANSRPCPQYRAAHGSARVCADAMSKLKYRGAGTIEFLYENGEFYFIEMNTRSRSSIRSPRRSPASTWSTSRSASPSGGGLSDQADDVRFNGHAIECRINAEDPRTFVPSPGRDHPFPPPGGLGVRVDSAVYQGYSIPPYYDSLIGKLIVHGRTRVECMMRLRRALDEFVVDGIKTTFRCSGTC